MAKITITEAIAELKTIDARVVKKRELIGSCIARQEAFKDPHEKDGGSLKVIERESQAASDLCERSIKIRRAIAVANQTNDISVGGTTRSIADWLCWRRDVAPGVKSHLEKIQKSLQDLRKSAQQKGWQVNATDPKPPDLIVNINEMELAKDLEYMEEVLGTLDGQLSLKNATITVDIGD